MSRFAGGEDEPVCLVVGQVYSFEDERGRQWHWSIAIAQALAERRGIVETVSLSEAGITPEFILSQYPDLDEVYALNTDLAKPLIFVPFRGKVRFVDGWHRVFRAALTGVDILPAYFLTQQEADAALVTLPSGVRLDWGQPKRDGGKP